MLEQVFPNGIQTYLVGGLLIGVAVSFAFAMSGLVAGMSTVLSSTWSFVSRLQFFQQARFTSSRGWRLALAIGLVIGGVLFLLKGDDTVEHLLAEGSHVSQWFEVRNHH